MDSDCFVFFISLEVVDDVCVKFDYLVRNEMLFKDDIFYKYIKVVVYFYINLWKY